MTDAEKIEQLEAEVKKLNRVIDRLISSNATYDPPVAAIPFGIHMVKVQASGKDTLDVVDKKLREAIDSIVAGWERD